MVAMVTVAVELHLLKKKKKKALSVQVYIFHTIYSEILSTFYEIPHLMDGIATWRQAAQEQLERHLPCLDSGAPGRKKISEYFLWSKSKKDSILFFHT